MSNSSEPPEIQRLRQRTTVSVEDAGEVFGLRRGASYRAVARGDIPSIRIGGKIVCPTRPILEKLGYVK
jgi:hypothetical protein